MKRRMCVMEEDCKTRIEKVKNIMRHMQVAKDTKDWGKVPGLKKEMDDATGP